MATVECPAQSYDRLVHTEKRQYGSCRIQSRSKEHKLIARLFDERGFLAAEVM